MLFVLNSLTVGGSETKIIRVANALASSGDRAELAYLNPPESALARIDPAVSVTNLHRRGKYSISSFRRLRDLVNRERQAVVAVNLYPLLYVVPAVKFDTRQPACDTKEKSARLVRHTQNQNRTHFE